MTSLLLAVMAAGDAPPPSSQLAEEAQTLLQQKRYPEAAAKAAAFRTAWPDDLLGYALLADAQMGMGKLAEAEKNIQWMLDLRRNDPRGMIRAARFRVLIKDREGARAMYEQALQRMPDDGPERRELVAEIRALESRRTKR